MDTSDPQISFNDLGVCNHCMRFDNLIRKRTHIGDTSKTHLKELVLGIKAQSQGKKYDCIIGVSGGVDSTFVAYLVKRLGLKPLAVHLDNGWNSELAVSNIEKVIDVLGIDLYTYVMNWDAFKNYQIAFLKSSTPDGEIPTDHSINSVLFQIAVDQKIKYIINGMNFTTEGMSVPSWSYGHSDWYYIKNIYKSFGVKEQYIQEYPHCNLSKLIYYLFFKRIKVVSILNYISYNKSNAIKIITKELGWVEYPQKHYESIYTRFYQGYYLIEKFGFDKRRGHLSDLIRSNQITRNDAITAINLPPYKSIEFLSNDVDYVIKKLGLSKKELEDFIEAKNRTHLEYKNVEKYINMLKSLYNALRLREIFPK